MHIIIKILYYNAYQICLGPFYGFKKVPDKISFLEEKKKKCYEQLKGKSKVRYTILKGVFICIFVIYTIYYTLLH